VAISGDGGFPLRSSWLRPRNSGRQYLLRGTSHATYFNAAVEAAFTDFLFGEFIGPVVTSVTTSNAFTSTTTCAVPMPATVAAGDLLLAFISGQNSASTWTGPTGWVELADASGQAVYYKIADGTEGGTSPTFTVSASQRSQFSIFRVTNWHGTTPPEIAFTTGTTSTSPDAPSLTPSWGLDSDLWLWFVGFQNTTRSVVYPDGFTDNVTRVNSSFAGTNGAHTVATRNARTDTWDVLPGTFGASTSFFLVATVVVRPQSAGASVSLAATEAADTASLALTAEHTAALAATEAADTAAIALTATHTAALAATEAADTAAIAVDVVTGYSVVLATTETQDTASLALTAEHTAALAATEAQDAVAIAATSGINAALAATEAQDVAAISVLRGHLATLAATEAADTVAIFVAPGATASLAATEAPDTAAIITEYGIVRAGPSYAYWAKTQNKKKPKAPKLPPPVNAGEVVVDEAVLRQIEEERLNALVLQNKQQALQRVEDLRGGYAPAPQPARAVTLDRKRFDVVESSPDIRRRVVSLLREPTPPPATEPVKGPVLFRRLGARNLPQPQLQQARYVSLRRSSDQLKQTG